MVRWYHEGPNSVLQKSGREGEKGRAREALEREDLRPRPKVKRNGLKASGRDRAWGKTWKNIMSEHVWGRDRVVERQMGCSHRPSPCHRLPSSLWGPQEILCSPSSLTPTLPNSYLMAQSCHRWRHQKHVKCSP